MGLPGAGRHREARVTIDGAARLLGSSGGEIETTSGCSGPMIDIRELAEQAVHVWPIDAIEEALGREAATWSRRCSA